MAKGKFERWREPEGLILIEGWARDGLTEEQIAKKMNISRSTLSDWKTKFSDISNALKKGKEVADYQVENALFKRACGYDVVEIRQEKDSGGKVTKTVKTRKHIPPDTTAIIYWLKNRLRGKYQDKPEPVSMTEVADDGLIDALEANAEDLFADGDDGNMIPEMEDDTG